MQANILKYYGKVYGVQLLANGEQEIKILRRLFDGGLKANALHGDSELHITFADLIIKQGKKRILYQAQSNASDGLRDRIAVASVESDKK